MNRPFINLVTLFKNEQERTNAFLKEYYYKSDALQSIISNITSEFLTDKTIYQKKILLKPNFVKHSNNPNDEICLRTHENFILAVLEIILKRKPTSVTIGDAPIQGCRWDKIANEQFLNQINFLSGRYKIDVTVKDFRRKVWDADNNGIPAEINSLNNYLLFDLGKKSYLEPITMIGRNLFRVTQYNSTQINKSHHPGVHEYCIINDLFDSDLIISLPKIKTHQKTCFTGALKNIVGLNGDKDFLPHHRLGGTGIGGDCYPGNNFLKYWAERSLDVANRNQGNILYWFWLRMSSLLWNLALPGPLDNLGAGWYGNDTTWRMVMDLNEVIIYGKADGTLAYEPQRVLYSLCDGIIGGEGEGPLHPQPFPLGFVSFSNNSALTDLCFGRLLNLNENKIPLLRSVKGVILDSDFKVRLNGREANLNYLSEFSYHPKLTKGWENYLDQ
jgi:uncharacterized protein (DUF362 family)